MQSTNLLVMSIYASMNEGSVIYGRGRTFHLVQIPFISKSARHTICIQAPDRLAIIYVLYIHVVPIVQIVKVGWVGIFG